MKPIDKKLIIATGLKSLDAEVFGDCDCKTREAYKPIVPLRKGLDKRWISGVCPDCKKVITKPTNSPIT